MFEDPQADFVREIIAGLNSERDEFLRLLTVTTERHPTWLPNEDARINLLAKPVNLILAGIVNLLLLRSVLFQVEFWRDNISPQINTPDAAGPPYMEQHTFYRLGIFHLLFSNIEHGFRAIQPKVVDGTQSHSNQPFLQVYSTLFKTAVPDQAEAHIHSFDFLRTLRNTIHNNGVYWPTNGKAVEFDIEGRNYIFTVGRRAEYLGWENFVEWLRPIRRALTDVVTSEAVASIESIPDVASHA